MRMLLKLFIHVSNFFFGNAKVSHRVFIVQPKMIRTSESLPSSANLSNDKQSSL
jgi:hypothetical protein